MRLNPNHFKPQVARQHQNRASFGAHGEILLLHGNAEVFEPFLARLLQFAKDLGGLLFGAAVGFHHHQLLWIPNCSSPMWAPKKVLRVLNQNGGQIGGEFDVPFVKHKMVEQSLIGPENSSSNIIYIMFNLHVFVCEMVACT